MFDHPLPLPLDYRPVADTLRLVVERILHEKCIYGNPEPAEAPRPDLPYSMLEVMTDPAIGAPYIRRPSIDDDTSATEDVQEIYEEPHQAIVRCYCYGNAAMWRANLLSTAYSSSKNRALWGDKRLQRVGTATFAPRLIGHHHERGAFLDFQIRHNPAVSEYLYSIKSVSFSEA